MRCIVLWGSFYQYGLTLFSAGISNHMPSKVWDDIIFPFPYFNGCIIKVCGWIRNFSQYFMMDVVIYPCCDQNLTMWIKGTTGVNLVFCWRLTDTVIVQSLPDKDYRTRNIQYDTVIKRNQLSPKSLQYTPYNSAVRASFGVYFATLNFDLYFASIITVLYWTVS